MSDDSTKLAFFITYLFSLYYFQDDALDSLQPTVRFPTSFTASDDTTSLAVDVHVAREPTDHDPFGDSAISMTEEGDVVCLPTIPDGLTNGKALYYSLIKAEGHSSSHMLLFSFRFDLFHFFSRLSF